MKKLMFAAAVAAVASISQAACGLETPASCQLPVWDFQMMLRADTLCLRVGTASQAEHCGLPAAELCGCYRELQTLTYAGVWYICNCGCDFMVNAEATGESSIMVDFADMTRKLKYADGALVANIRNAQPTNPIKWQQLYRVGAYAGKIAAIAKLEFGVQDEDGAWNGDLTLAGFGAFPLEATYFQTYSGYVTGTVPASGNCADGAQVDEEGNPLYCGIYDICNPGVVASDVTTWPAPNETVATAVAYGQFQVKFNQVASDRLTATAKAIEGTDPVEYDYDVKVILPEWFIK